MINPPGSVKLGAGAVGDGLGAGAVGDGLGAGAVGDGLGAPSGRRLRRRGLGPSKDGDGEACADDTCVVVPGGGTSAATDASWIGEALADGYGAAAAADGDTELGTARYDAGDGAAAAW